MVLVIPINLKTSVHPFWIQAVVCQTLSYFPPQKFELGENLISEKKVLSSDLFLNGSNYEDP